MDLQELITKYMRQGHMMQLATVAADQPWCCSVYYVVDEDCNIYWASIPDRRHSKEIAMHGNVAGAIPIQFAKGEKVIGLQVEGTASMVDSPGEIKQIAKKYASKFDRTMQWVEEFSSGQTKHKLYRLKPKLIVLFDEQNFSGPDARQEWHP
ncbi:hypothetical protein BH23PAT1_BH23PAT1_2900 [soil metagenome]